MRIVSISPEARGLGCMTKYRFVVRLQHDEVELSVKVTAEELLDLHRFQVEVLERTGWLFRQDTYTNLSNTWNNIVAKFLDKSADARWEKKKMASMEETPVEERVKRDCHEDLHPPEEWHQAVS